MGQRENKIFKSKRPKRKGESQKNRDIVNQKGKKKHLNKKKEKKTQTPSDDMKGKCVMMMQKLWYDWENKVEGEYWG